MTSLRKAIDEKCKDCIYDSLATGTWRQQVFLCSVEMCPLWKVRPKPYSPTPKLVYGENQPDSPEIPSIEAETNKGTNCQWLR